MKKNKRNSSNLYRNWNPTSNPRKLRRRIRKGSSGSIHVPGRRGWDADTAWWAPDAAPARLSTWSHRCASRPPSAPEDVTSTAAGRGRWSTYDVDVSMIPTRGAHLSLTACRGSVTTSFVSRLPGTRWSSAELRRRDAGRASGVDGGVPWRQSSGVATLYQECIRRCRLTVERGWGWMAENRLEDF